MPKSTKRPSPDERPDPLKLPHLSTAWHPLFYLVLGEMLPAPVFYILFEFLLNKEPTRLDAVIIRRLRHLTDWKPDFLRAFFACLGKEDTIVEFKGPNHSVSGGDLLNLLGKSYLYMEQAEAKGSLRAIDLLMVFNNLTPSLSRRIEVLGGTIHHGAKGKGMHRVDGLAFPLVLVETSLAWEQKGEYLLGVFARKALKEVLKRAARLTEKEQRLLTKVFLGIEVLKERSDAMTIQEMERLRGEEMDLGDLMAELMRRVSPEIRERILAPIPAEERLKDLPPEERLKGLPPEERLKGLPPEERLKGLPPEERLKGLSPEEIAHLLTSEQIIKALSPELLKKLREEEH